MVWATSRWYGPGFAGFVLGFGGLGGGMGKVLVVWKGGGGMGEVSVVWARVC